jgi:hypothetical protein
VRKRREIERKRAKEKARERDREIRRKKEWKFHGEGLSRVKSVIGNRVEEEEERLEQWTQ